MLPSSKGKKVLVIDDSPTILQWISSLLYRDGFVIETSKSIWVAPLVAKFKPDIIVVDVNICRSRNQDGPMIIQTLRSRRTTKYIKFILCSSLEENELESLARECGADGWIKKTVDQDHFMRQFQEIISSSNFYSTM